MNGQKRPAAPRSRGNSPPTQRRRHSEQSAIAADKYVNTSHSTDAFSPLYFKKNSAAGMPANVQTEPTTHSVNEHHVHPNRPNSNRNVFHDHDRLQSGGGPASSRKANTKHSPMHVISPISNGSWSSTPVQVAPTVPSMLPTVQKSMSIQSAPMDTLNVLRSKKTSIAKNVFQTMDCSTTMQVKTLKAQLKIAQIEDAKLRTHVKQLEHQIKQLEALPAELASLKALVGNQDRVAAQRASSDDTSHRLGALEDPKPAIEPTRLAQLQSDVQAMKLAVKKLNSLPEQLKKLQSTVTQHDMADIVRAIAKIDKLEIDTRDLASIREDLRSVVEQREVIKDDAVEVMIQTAMQPEIKKMDAFRTENNKTFEGISTKLDVHQKLCNDLNRRDLPGQIQNLQEKFNLVKSKDGKIHRKVTTLDENLKALRKDHDDFSDAVNYYIGPMKKSYVGTECTVLQRIKHLADDLQSLRKKQDHPSTEHKQPSTETDRRSVDPTASKELADIVYSLGEDTKKLAKRVEQLEAMPTAPLLPAPLTGSPQLEKTVEALEKRVSDINNTLDRTERNQHKQRLITGQISAFQSEQSRMGDAQRSLENEHDTIAEQIKTTESERPKLSNKQKTVASQVEKCHTKQLRLPDSHVTVANQAKTCRVEQESLVNQHKAFQTEQTRLSDEQRRFNQTLESLSNRVTTLEKTVDQTITLENEKTKLSNEQMRIGERFTKLETGSRPVRTLKQAAEGTHIDLIPSTSEVEAIQQRLGSLEDRIIGETGLAKIIDDLQEDSEEMEVKIHNHERDIEMFRLNFVAIFNQQFDPFKASVEQQLQSHSRHLDHHAESLANLANLAKQFTKPQMESPTLGLTASQLTTLNTVAQDMTSLKQALTLLRESFNAEVENRKSTVNDLNEQIALKQDTTTSIQANDAVKAAVRNLQNQYDNISTDDLHKKMVHWFLQQYPSTPANLVQQFATTQHVVTRLRDFMNQINWVPHYTQPLSALARIEPQLQALVQSSSESNDLQETLVKTKEALKAINEATAKVHKQNQSLTKTTGSLQTSTQTLNSSNKPFAKIESVMALEQSIHTLRADIDAGFTEERRSRNEFVAKAGKEHDQRVSAEKSIKLSVQDVTMKAGKEHQDRVEVENSMMLSMNERFKETSEHLESLGSALSRIRTDFDEMFNKFIAPNKQILDRLTALFMTTGQLQQVVRSLNQNLPKGPLDITWCFDLNADLNATATSESDETQGYAQR